MKDAQYKIIIDAARERGAKFPRDDDWLRFKAAIDAAVNDNATVIVVPAPTFGVPTVDLAKFFATMRESRALGPTLSEGEVAGCEAIIEACAGWPVAWTAYALATACLETAGTMKPIKEYGGTAYFRRMYDPQGSRPKKAAELGNTVPGDGAMFAGRGYVQLTGRTNYAKAQSKLGVPFIGNPDLAMEPTHAAAIMREGMQAGWFTTRKLSDYLPQVGKATAAQFKEARRIINGTDRAADIASYALEFQKGLMA